MGFRMSGDAFGAVATQIAAGAVALGNLSVVGDLTMESGAQLFIDAGDASNPGLAFRTQTNCGLALIAVSLRLVHAATSILNISSTAVAPQVALDCSGGSYLAYRGTTGITAVNPPAQGSGALTAGRNYHTVDTVGAANDCVTMPSALAGQLVIIANRGANTLQIFPASGDNFQGSAVNASITLAAGGEGIYLAVDTTVWVRVLN